MVDDKFPKPDTERTADPTEGVRIIGAEEAAEAVERGEVASRRGGDSPRYGDRPKPPPVGPRPALRFPLDPSADPTSIDKPPARPSGIEFEPLAGIGEPGAGQRFDPLPDADALPLDEPPVVIEPAAEPLAPEASPMFATADDDTGPISVGPEPLPDDSPAGSAAAPEAPVELPHWSDPATGEVPRSIVGEPVEGDDDLDAWSSFASSSPRWRDGDSDREWEADGAMHEMLGADADWRVGAMDDSRPTNDEIYSFEDLDRAVPAAPVAFDDDLDVDFDPDRSFDEEPAEVGGPITIGRGRRQAPPRRNPVADYASGGSGYAPPTGGAGRNIGLAAGVGVGLVAVFAVLCKLGPKFALGFVVVALAFAAVEYFNAVRRAGYQPAVLLGLVASITFPIAVYWKGLAAYPVMMVVILVASLMWHLVGADGDARVVESVGVTLLGIGWVGGLGSFAALMLASPNGMGFLWAAIIATVGYDVGGLFVGRSAGSRPLSEASPNKTIEGLVGGVLVSLFLTVVIVGFIGIAPFDNAGAACIVAIAAVLAAPLGDLCESLVKRDLGIKDMSSILPEHGGVLDRFDGLLFVLPAVFYAAMFFSVGPFKG